MAEGDVLLRVDSVSQRLGQNQILEKASFEVKDRVRPACVTGQVVGLLGPSGVGKTRMLRLVAGLDRPDSGSVRDEAGNEIQPGTVGVVFQNYPLLRHRTVIGNLLMAGRACGLARAESRQRVEKLLDRFGLAARADFYPVQLSGGQRQRVAIAQQLVRLPRLVLMDEPFSGLDPVALDATMKLLVEVANMDELNTIIVVTHDIRAALTVCDTLFMLGRDRTADGRITSGARIQHTYDLVAMGLAYHEDLPRMPEFVDLERELKAKFATL